MLNAWLNLPDHYPHITLDAFVIMPNHVHGIIVLEDNNPVVGAGLKPAPTTATTAPPTKPVPPPTSIKRHGLPEIVRAFKTFSARHVNEYLKSPGIPLWQRNYVYCDLCSVMNASSATKQNGIVSASISKPTQPGGATMRRIQPTRRGRSETCPSQSQTCPSTRQSVGIGLKPILDTSPTYWENLSHRGGFETRPVHPHACGENS